MAAYGGRRATPYLKSPRCGPAQITFHVDARSENTLESVAAAEGRSVAQICEAFLHAGLTKYEKEGTKYVQKFLARLEQET